MTKSLECAVIGAGAVGAAAAYHLARAGAAVTLFEQYPLLHDRGSSHGATRLFRLAYFERSDYAPLLRRSVEMWRDLEIASGERLFFQIGAFQAGAGDGVLIPGLLKTAAEHDLQVEKLSDREVSERFPWFNLPKDFAAVVEPQAGFILAEQAVRTHLEAARALGVRILAECKVRGWRSQRGRLTLETDNGDFRFDRVVVTPGAWANALLGDLGVDIRPVRKTLHWIAADDNRFKVAAGFTPFAIETKPAELFYGFPATDDDGVKVAFHSDGPAASSPESIDRTVSPEEDAPVVTALNSLAPGLPSAIYRRKVCLYEMSPDGHFIIDQHPDDERVVFAVGLSGHGFKFTPIIGEILSDLAIDGGTLSPIGFLRLNRFR